MRTRVEVIFIASWLLVASVIEAAPPPGFEPLAVHVSWFDTATGVSVHDVALWDGDSEYVSSVADNTVKLGYFDGVSRSSGYVIRDEAEFVLSGTVANTDDLLGHRLTGVGGTWEVRFTGIDYGCFRSLERAKYWWFLGGCIGLVVWFCVSVWQWLFRWFEAVHDDAMYVPGLGRRS